jgi:hypothetical protein
MRGKQHRRTTKSEDKRDYEVGRGKPPAHTRFKKGQSGDPRGPRPKNLPALLLDVLNEKVVVTIDGERQEITKRKAIVTQLVNTSTAADLRATKMLIDMMKNAEKKTGAAPPPEPSPLTPTDKEVVKGFVERVRRALLQEIQDLNAGNPALAMIFLPSSASRLGSPPWLTARLEQVLRAPHLHPRPGCRFSRVAPVPWVGP